MDIQRNVKDVLGEIAGRAQIVAASKYVGATEIAALYEAGIVIMGENRADALEQKVAALNLPIQWHFIGTLQSRKVKSVVSHIDCLHSLDRLSLAKEIHKYREVPLRCLVQVNVSGEASKEGIAPSELLDFLEALKPYDKVQVAGLMTMAPNTTDESLIRATFRGLRELRELAMQAGYSHIQELSMGMSNDYRIALEEGATLVRLGSVLFQN